MSFCTNYFVANWETLITNRKPAGALIVAIGVADLCIFVRHFHPVSLRFYGSTANIRVPRLYPFLYPFLGGFQDTAAHFVTPRDTKNGVFIGRLRFS